jgi:formylglycine-generating enzyme required for sulfatase activity
MTIANHRPATCAALAAFLCCVLGSALGETSSVIDPTEGLERPKAPVAEPKKAPAPDATLKRERQRARAEAAEKEKARLRALEQARISEAAAREAAAREAAAREAAAKKAAAVKAEAARAAARASARLIAQQTAAKEAAKEVAFREMAARELAMRDAAAKEAAARELAAREAAAREAAARDFAAREAAAKETAAKEAARAAAAKEVAERLNGVKLIATGEVGREPRMLKGLARSGNVFRDCAGCPELVWLPPGQFVLGDASLEGAARPKVAIQYPLAIGRFEITFAEWDACFADGGCRRRPHDAGWGRGWQPVINVSWKDAQQYTAWLSRKTNRRYRLLTEAEWEYAARAGTDARYWWGDQPGHGDANCADCGSKWDGRQAAPVGRFAPSPFGVYDMHGNVAEWVEDCYHDRLREAPVDGRAWTSACGATADTRILRGGAWHGSARSVRSSFRTSAALDHFDNGIGFRVARSE